MRNSSYHRHLLRISHPTPPPTSPNHLSCLFSFVFVFRGAQNKKTEDEKKTYTTDDWGGWVGGGSLSGTFRPTTHSTPKKFVFYLGDFFLFFVFIDLCFFVPVAWVNRPTDGSFGHWVFSGT